MSIFWLAATTTSTPSHMLVASSAEEAEMLWERRHTGSTSTLSTANDPFEHDVRRQLTEQFRSREAAVLTRSPRGENETELRLDYEDVAAGRVVIVIQGVP